MVKMPRLFRLTAATILLLLPETQALDVELGEILCDKELPVYATEFYMSCDDGKRCTFGEQGTFFGNCKYKVLHHAAVGL